MSNELAIPAPPAYLATTQMVSDWKDFAAKTVSGSFARISIKGSRWRLQELNGEEHVVPALHLDVFIVYANPDKSKNFYSKPYDQTATVPAAPDCFSDNGVSPSSRATTPQCISCAACPHNVWGSKINANGSKTKGCQDSQRLAVVLADNPTGTIYELRIPAASLKDMGNTLKQFVTAGVNPSTVRFRLEFDSAEEFPKIVFKATAYATQQEWHAIEKLIGSTEAKRVTGREDAQAPVAAIAPTQPLLAVAPPAFAVAVAVPQSQAAPFQFSPATTQVVSGFASIPAPAPEKPKRTRRSKEQIAAEQAVQAPPAAPAQAFFSPPAPAAVQQVLAPALGGAVAGVVINPIPISDTNLDSLLAGAFKL